MVLARARNSEGRPESDTPTARQSDSIAMALATFAWCACAGQVPRPDSRTHRRCFICFADYRPPGAKKRLSRCSDLRARRKPGIRAALRTGPHKSERRRPHRLYRRFRLITRSCRAIQRSIRKSSHIPVASGAAAAVMTRSKPPFPRA